MDDPDQSWHYKVCGMRNIPPSLFSKNDTHTAETTIGSEWPTLRAPMAISSPLPPRHKTHTGKKHSVCLLIVSCKSLCYYVIAFKIWYSPDVVVVTENGLSQKHAGKIGETDRFCSEYQIHRQDRETDTSGGGVFIVVKTTSKVPGVPNSSQLTVKYG